MSYSKRRELFSMYRQSVDSLPRNDKKYIINSNNNIISTSDIDGFLLMFKTRKSVNDVFVFFKNIGQPILDDDDIPLTLKHFYKKYCCDLDWAKNEDYCKVASTGGGGNGSTGGGGSVSQGWLADPTGNKTWEYQLRDCKWFARKIGKTNEYKISDEPKYASSVKYLNDANPNLIKNCNKTNTDDKPEETKVETAPVNLPDWATCLKVIKTLIVTQDSAGDTIVKAKFDTDWGYFWKDMTFLYVSSKDGTKFYGKWSCKDNVLVIKTDDGDVWMKDSGWVTPPNKTDNADNTTPKQNFNPTQVSGDEFSTGGTPEPKSSQEVSSDEFEQNESTMNNLENIINEVNTLIIEQTQQIVQAPQDELTILTTSPLLKDKGTLESLCRSGNGTSIPVNVNGKIYFAGKKTKRKNIDYYLTYDGMVLKREGDSCKFTYAPTDDGKSVMKIKEIPFSNFKVQQTEILRLFGINPLDYNSDPYYQIKVLTDRFQDLITNKKARSMVFKSWNDMLTYWDPTRTLRLKGVSGDTTFMTYPPNDELDQYNTVTADNLGLTYMDKQIKIFIPRGERLTNDFKGAKYDPNKCRADLVAYLSAAFEFQKQGVANNSLNSNSVRKGLQGCYRSGVFDSMTPITATDIDVQFTKKDNPFIGMRGFGSDFDIKDVQKLLTGDNFKLPKVGPSGNNPFLPLTLDTRQMNESKTKLDSLIKENLQKLSEEKNNNLLAETNIIQIRTKILTENRILKFKQPREKFFNEIISEALYLESQGFDKQLIKEEFWDVLKGMFGQHGSEAIFGTFKEYMGKWLLQKLTPVNPEGWIGSIVVAAIGNLHIDDLSKLTDCNFLTKKLSSSIGEGIARKIQHDKGYDGGISDIVRNGLFSAIDNTEMVKSLENGLAKLICPALSGVKSKLEDKAQKMKTMAVQA